MEAILTAFGVAALAFASTNVDDIVLLVLFFSSGRFRPLQVVAGQYLGIGALVVISLIVAFAARNAPLDLVRWLGLLPIAIGCRWLLELLREGPRDSVSDAAGGTGAARSALAVAAVTFANGGDNIGVYVPLFAKADTAALAAALVTFGALTAVWCYVGFASIRYRQIGERLAAIGRRIAPLVLIAIGVSILLDVG